MNKFMTVVGTYPVTITNDLLDTIELYSIGAYFMRMIFDIIIILLVAISALSIYSISMTLSDK